jgi:hypothetical protein
VITVDEGDHFAGGTGIQQAGTSWLVYDHRTCTSFVPTTTNPNPTPCPTNQIGEVGTNIQAILGNTPSYDIHLDDAPTFYVQSQPGPTDPGVRALERAAGTATALDPYAGTSPIPIAQRLADPVEEKALHMVNNDPRRTPTFTMFGNPDFFFQTSNPCSGLAQCVTPGFAWNHGDFQDEIGSTWVGFVGPGVAHAKDGIDSTTWTDHTNVRPTILALTDLKDDYVDDGWVIVEALTKPAAPAALTTPSVKALLASYEQVNAPFGAFAMNTLKSSTYALKSNAVNDQTYTDTESAIGTLTSQRDALVAQIRTALYNAAFSGGTISDSQAQGWTTQANALITQAQQLPGV